MRYRVNKEKKTGYHGHFSAGHSTVLDQRCSQKGVGADQQISPTCTTQ